MKAIILSFVVLIGVLVSAPAFAQSCKVTASGGWNLAVDVAQPNAPLTVSVDGAAAVPAVGVSWSGSTAQIPQSQMPAAARAIGAHTFVITDPGQAVTLADGSSVQIGGGSLTTSCDTIDTTPKPPKNPHWIKIAGTLAAAITGATAIALAFLL